MKDKLQSTSDELIMLLEKIKTVVKTQTNEQYIPNIIEFCTSAHYLGLPVELYPMQKIILKCVSGDNYVIDGDTHNRITVKEFCKQNRRSILSFKENAYEELIKSDVNWCGANGRKRLFEITLKNTKHKIQVTEDHQMLTHLGYKQLKDISNNDYIVIPNKIPTSLRDAKITDSEIKLLAYFIGDGSCTRWPHFVSNDKELLIRKDFQESILSYDPSLDFRFRQQSGYNMIKIVKGNNNRNPHLKNSVWEFLQRHKVASKSAHQKRIPSIVYHLSHRQLCLFLSRLFATDGHACLLRNNSSISHAVIGYTTCNYDLAEDVKHLLLRIGILADVTSGQVSYEYNNKKSKKNIFQVIIRRSTDILNFCDQIQIINKEKQQKDVENFCKSVSSYSVVNRLPDHISEKLNHIFKSKRKSRRTYRNEDQIKFDKLYKNKKYNKQYAEYVFDLTSDKYAYQISRSCLVYDQIKEIVDIGIHEVYDISVENTRNFICNDMIVHNCFYRGQPGNENIELTEEEIQLLFEYKLDNVLEKYHSGNLFRELVLVLGRRCISEDTLIFDANTGESKNISDWHKENGELTVWTLNEELSRFEKHLAKTIYQGKRDCVRVALENGDYVDCTFNHPLLSVDGWLNVEDLKPGDEVAQNDYIPKPDDGEGLKESEASILGYIIGDGNCTTSRTYFTTSDECIIEHLQECLGKLSKNMWVKYDNNKQSPYQYSLRQREIKFKQKIRPDGRKIGVRDTSDLFKFLTKHGLQGKTAKQKRVSQSVFSASSRAKAAFLNAYFSCDGYAGNTKNSSPKIELYSVNKLLLEDVQNLLKSLYIQSKIYVKKSNIKIEGIGKSYEYKNHKSYRLQIQDQRSLFKFCNYIGMKKSYDVSRVIDFNVEESVEFTKIKDIKAIGTKKTYDLSIMHENRQTCNFIVNNGLQMHNSGKDFMVSLMALYEVMRLLEIPGGSPFKYYNIAEGNPIFILTVANSADQARILFTEIKEKMTSSDYFRDKIGHMEADKISLRTPQDIAKQKQLLEDRLDNAASKIKGSVVIMSGHSNSESLLGKRIYCCAKGSMIISSKGLMPIEEFSKPNEEIDEILHGLEGMVVADKCFNNGRKDTLIMQLSSGNKIEITPQHKLYVWDKEHQHCEFRKASKIKNGDFLLGQYGQNLWGVQENIDFSWEKKKKRYGDKISCPICLEQKEQINAQHLKSHNLTSKEFSELYHGYPTRSDIALSKFSNMKNNPVPKALNPQLCRIMGYIISEGNNTHNNVNITNTELDVIEDMLSCMNDCFVNVKHKTGRRRTDKSHWKTRHQIFLFDQKERKLLQHLGCNIALSDKKEIPRSILLAPKKLVCEFLKAYFEGDGCVSDDRIFANSTSERLISQIYYVLLNMGIFSTIQYKPSNKHRNQWIVSIYGEDILEYEKQIGFIGQRKKSSLANLAERIKTKNRKKNKFGLPIGNLIKLVNRKNNKTLKEFNKEYGFYGFPKQHTVSLSAIQKWQEIYYHNKIRSPLDEIVNSKLFGDQVIQIDQSNNQVYDFHVSSASHSYCCNGLINHNSLLLDEVASFKTTGGNTSGDRIYTALTPSTADFVRKTGEKGEDGKDVIVMDSKIISISSPRSEEGMLFKLYSSTSDVPSRLAFKLPTWKVSKQWDEATLRQEFKFMSVNDFSMEFGAEFSGTAGEKFIPDHYIDEALEIGAELGLAQSNAGLPGIVYYAHLDPAATSHNYALVILHVEERIRLAEKNGQIIKEKTKMFIVDHLKCWQPEGGQAINVHEVDQYIMDLARRFRFAMVSYDHWNSQSSVQMLRRKGIPTKITPFRREYKMKIYDHLEHLLVNHQLAIPRKTPFSQMMEMELKCLKRIYLPTGFKIEPNPEAPITTDDFADAIAGACGLASESMYTGYPQGGLVYMPQMPSLGANTQWRIGNASYSDQQWRLWHRKFGI